MTKRFVNHGVNAPEPWVLGLTDPGLFHPNLSGYRAYAAAVTSSVNPRDLRGERDQQWFDEEATPTHKTPRRPEPRLDTMRWLPRSQSRLLMAQMLTALENWTVSAVEE
ncbi:hypothetical protein ACI3ET_15835 [Ornithinimicrobium sp. LYQ121]|uniref:hypothetical protein n=1 Tax=Ornithinimicrobium sp. LYQ121 TaxID=3378801 RepID=UPI003852CBFD